MSAHEVNHFLTLMQEEIRQYQVTQEANDLLTVKLVKGRSFKDSIVAEIKQAYTRSLGDEVKVDVLMVDDIQREKSGKFRLFKTNIPLP